MNEFKVGDYLYNPKLGSKYIVVSNSEYNHAMNKLFGDCMNITGNVCMPLLALTDISNFHAAGEYIVVFREWINDPRYSSDITSTYEKIEI